MPSHPKPSKVKSKKNLQAVRSKPCIFCAEENCPQVFPTEADHIDSKGSGGDDSEDNLWPACTKHHAERHRIGILTFIRKYSSARIFLGIMGRQDILSKAREQI